MNRLPVLAMALAVMALAPSVAFAGSCPVCTSSSECTSPDDTPAFCVLHDHDVGCGMERQICCPGQGCNTFSGRPSCEETGTCTVVDDVDPDAGGIAPPDSGAEDAAVDAARDAAPADASSRDGATPDAGSADATPPGMTDDDGGCDCSVASRRGPAGALAASCMLAAVLVRRRRKRLAR